MFKGVLRHREIDDADTGMTHRLQVAYIWSSEEAASVADARHRALTTAEDALGRAGVDAVAPGPPRTSTAGRWIIPGLVAGTLAALGGWLLDRRNHPAGLGR